MRDWAYVPIAMNIPITIVKILFIGIFVKVVDKQIRFIKFAFIVNDDLMVSTCEMIMVLFSRINLTGAGGKLEPLWLFGFIQS